MQPFVSVAAILTLGLFLSGCAVGSLASSVVDAGASVASVPFDIAGGAIDAVSGGDDEAEH